MFTKLSRLLSRSSEGSSTPPPRASREDTHDYWRSPDDGVNAPREYLEARGQASSEFLLSIVRRYAEPAASILEIGCNAGRNLEHLRRAGYRSLTGVEISASAVEHLQMELPELADVATIQVGSAEELLPQMADGQFDLVFTMAVLVHVHPESSRLFEEIERVSASTLIAIEDEETVSPRHFKRRYRELFEGLGMREVEAIPCGEATGLPSFYGAHVFSKAG